MTETSLRRAIVEAGRSLHVRGLTPGASGNISVRTASGIVLTPTGASLGALDVDDLSVVDADGRHVAGPPPTKELNLHRRMYEQRPDIEAVTHLHSAHAVAVSLLARVDAADALPPLTPYQVMRVGRLPVIPYARPGSDKLAELLAEHLHGARCALLANHGTIAGGSDLAAAVEAAEEIEHSARVWLLVGERAIVPLSQPDVADLEVREPQSSYVGARGRDRASEVGKP
jgi:ribulose-5-phosphate 4-epimerase/fuculose-1-phosphate aldolase